MFGDGIKLFGVRKGTCGEDLIWVLKDNILTISGNGIMDDFNFDEDKVTSSAPWFRYSRYIFGIDIQDGITRIGNYAFAYLTRVGGIKIPNSVKEIGAGAFYVCAALSLIRLPYSVATIGRQAFYGCSNLRAIELPDFLNTIEEAVFMGCSRLQAVSIPHGLCSIREKAFFHCQRLVTLNIPDRVFYIGEYAFAESGMVAINIPMTITHIAAYLFLNCEDLTRIKIPNHVANIGECAFSGCAKLKEIQIPDCVNKIGHCAFDGCRGLADAHGFVIIRNVLYGYYGTETEVWIPEGVTCIETAEGFNKLIAIHIPVSVRKIADGIFQDFHSNPKADVSRLKAVFYAGTAEQWWDIQIGNYNEHLIKAEFHCEKAAVLAPAAEPVNVSAGRAEQPELQPEPYSGSIPQFDRFFDDPSFESFAQQPESRLEPYSGSIPQFDRFFGYPSFESFAQQPEPRPEPQPKPYSGSEPYIFFSYCHRDIEPALKLIRLLQNDGFRVWYDEDIRPSAEFPKYISDHLDGCSCAVSLISEAYLNSEFCKKEIFYAEKNKIPQVLVYAEDVLLPSDWDLMIGLLQAIPNNIYQDDRRFLQKFRQTSGIDQCREG